MAGEIGGVDDSHDKCIFEKGAVDIIVNKISTVPNTTETWTFGSSDGSTVTKAVYIQ